MKRYTIEKPADCETWFLWENGEVLKTGSLETLTDHLCKIELKGPESNVGNLLLKRGI